MTEEENNMFDKKFRIMQQVGMEEVDGVFAIEEDREKIKKWIAENFISKKKVREVIENWEYKYTSYMTQMRTKADFTKGHIARELCSDLRKELLGKE